MKNKAFYSLLAALIVLSLALAACTPAAPAGEATEVPAQEQPTEAPAAEEPTEAPMEEQPTEAPAAEEPAGEFTPMTLTNETCGPADVIKEITAVDQYTVRFTLCRSDSAFLQKIAFESFTIQSSEWINETGGTGEILERPVGTGAYMVDAWNRGDSVNLVAFPDYWGEAALTPNAVIRWVTESAGRLQELQAGTAHMISNLGPEDIETVENDPNLQLIEKHTPNIFYLGFTNTFEPWNDVNVRKAIAMGIDRQRIVDNFMPPGSEVASHFTPCDIENGCGGEEWYEFDPEAARQLLADAGQEGMSTTIYYRDVFRDYLPNPGDVAVEVQTQLQENLGINAEVVVMETGEFIDSASNGRLDGIFLLGWSADYPHVTNFLDFHFSRNNPQNGDPYPEIYEPLEEGAAMLEPTDQYERANNAIKELVPLVPISHATAAYAALANLEGANVPPFGAQILSLMQPADGDTVVLVQNAEPISMYCADETDGESLSACHQVLEGLYTYGVDGTAVPALATSFEANDDATEWTFPLREGVMFHDGTTFDANDVVASFDAFLNAQSANHSGNTGAFEYPAYLFGLMNDE